MGRECDSATVQCDVDGPHAKRSALDPRTWSWTVALRPVAPYIPSV